VARQLHSLVRRLAPSRACRVPEGYIALVEELPGANTQGATLEEARENLREAVQLVLDANRALAREEAGEGDVIREQLKIAG
jgi:predicted RNase H-like HicB family nuclease